jgi:glucose/arabinose dehydrogenase
MKPEEASQQGFMQVEAPGPASSRVSRRIFAQAIMTVIVLMGAARAQDFNATPPNATGQRPAFAGQTRAPVIRDSIQLQTTLVAEGLENPWGMVQLPDGSWLVTERPGRMRLIGAGGTMSAPIRGVPEVDAGGQGGLLDVAIRDDFQQTRRVWWSYAEPRGNDTNATAVATGVLAADGSALSQVRVVFQQQPAWRSTSHFGSRLVFDRSGALFVTTGERSNPEPRQLAQDVGTHLGKVLRINPEGGPAEGNPTIRGGRPEIWSFGHRNLQSATIGPDGALWTVEHGARGGDELNRPEPGRNYGWPVITYGENYSGRPIGAGLTAQEGMEQPLYYWDPVIAPSGMVFYHGDMFRDWRGSLLVGGLADQSLVRLTLEGDRVAGEARYFQGIARVRDVDVAQDGAVMILTDAQDGALIRVTPAK